MALSREIYQEFEDIVGSDNISDDPALLDSYIYSLSSTSIHLGPYYGVSTPRGAGVLLPGNTEEVQAIVRLCNKHKISFKASSTFWGAMGYPSKEDVIQIDMRRMDRILEIDQKNMFAVIEPYVIGATLQAEAMKVGLNTHIIGAGSGCSPLASATSYLGQGPDTIFMGYGEENMLGLEWVMPNGELIRPGTPGSGLGWFCGEGPGPGLRGIIRGSMGAKGGMGIFTKCAIKLFPWPGPAKLPIEGTIPAYRAVLPKNLRAYTIAFPSWQAWADWCIKIWDAGIGYIAHRQFNMFGANLKRATIRILTDPAKTFSDMEELLKDPSVQKETRESKYDMEFVLAGMTSRDIEWQEKALDQILAETGGWKVPTSPELEQWILLLLIRMGHKNLNVVFSGGYDGSFCQSGTPDFVANYIDPVGKFKNEWEKKGAMVITGGDSMMGGAGGVGGGGGCGMECFVHFDPHEKESVEGVFDYFEAAAKYARDHKLPPGIERLNALSRGPDGKALPKEPHNRALLASKQPAAFRYQTKFKEKFDPNKLGDSYYSTLDD